MLYPEYIMRALRDFVKKPEDELMAIPKSKVFQIVVSYYQQDLDKIQCLKDLFGEDVQ